MIEHGRSEWPREGRLLRRADDRTSRAASTTSRVTTPRPFSSRHDGVSLAPCRSFPAVVPGPQAEFFGISDFQATHPC